MSEKSVFPETVSAYEVKNNSCLFERLLEIKKNGVFLFWNIFIIFRDIYVFVVMQMRKVMTS